MIKKRTMRKNFFVRIGPAVEEYSSDIKKLANIYLKEQKIKINVIY